MYGKGGMQAKRAKGPQRHVGKQTLKEGNRGTQMGRAVQQVGRSKE